MTLDEIMKLQREMKSLHPDIQRMVLASMFKTGMTDASPMGIQQRGQLYPSDEELMKWFQKRDPLPNKSRGIL